MVSARILDLDIGSNVTHISTDWQIATDELFANIVAESLADVVNKNNIVLDIVLDPTIKYYARARSLLDPGGYTVWGNIDTFIPQDINDIEADIDLPTYITLPTMSSVEDISVFPTTLFTITLSGYSAVGPATHDSTTWLVEDIHGNIIYSRIGDRFNKTSLTFVDIKLEENKLYRIKTVFNSTSNDSSQMASMTVATSGNKYSRIISNLGSLDVNVVNNIRLLFVPNITSVTWEIIEIKDNQYRTVYTNIVTTDLFNLALPANTLTSGSRYVVKVKSNLDTSYNYQNFSTI